VLNPVPRLIPYARDYAAIVSDSNSAEMLASRTCVRARLEGHLTGVVLPISATLYATLSRDDESVGRNSGGLIELRKSGRSSDRTGNRVTADAAHSPDVAAHLDKIKPVPRQFAESVHVAEKHRRPRARLRVPDLVTVLRIEVLHGISIMIGGPSDASLDRRCSLPQYGATHKILLQCTMNDDNCVEISSLFPKFVLYLFLPAGPRIWRAGEKVDKLSR
jgi:hypothetical protein